MHKQIALILAAFLPLCAAWLIYASHAGGGGITAQAAMISVAMGLVKNSEPCAPQARAAISGLIFSAIVTCSLALLSISRFAGTARKA